MNQSRTRLGSQDSGVIAIFLAAIIGILLLTSTTFAARVSTSELNQSSQVDQSEAAYYAAEAGVEEAIRRLVVNPTGTVCQIFPEQFRLTLNAPSGVCPAASSQFGDYALLRDAANPGAREGAGLAIATEGTAAANLPGNSWRYRKVTAQGNSFTGTQVKDESVQFDTSELCRRFATGVWGTTACDPSPTSTVGNDPLSNAPIAGSLKGLQYCWTPNMAPPPDIEFTDVYWTNINQIQTEKMILSPTAYASGPTFASGLILTSSTGLNAAPSRPTYDHCVTLKTVPGTKFIFRFKPLYRGITTDQNAHSIAYHAELVDAYSPTLSPLYLPTNTFLIDVVGESGDIKRRIVAKVTRNGGILGIFDYLIYSGSGNNLCKPGINQPELGGAYDTATCAEPFINNN